MEVLLAVLAVALILWLTTRYYGQREMTFEEATRQMALAVDDMKRTIGLRLLPALAASIAAFEDFETEPTKIERTINET